MIRRYCIKTIAAAMLCAGVTGGLMIAATPNAKSKPTSNENINPDKIITLQGTGEKERRCVIIQTDTRPDGTIAHQVKDLENGEIMTILEPKSSNSKTSSNDLKPLPPVNPPIMESKSVKTSKSSSVSPYNPVEKPNKMPDIDHSTKTLELEPVRIPTVDPIPSVKKEPPLVDPIPSAQNPPLSKVMKDLPPIPTPSPESKPDSTKVLSNTKIKPEIPEVKSTPISSKTSSTVVIPSEQLKPGLMKRMFNPSKPTNTPLPPKKVMTPAPATLTPIPKGNPVTTPSTNTSPKTMPIGPSTSPAPIINKEMTPPVPMTFQAIPQEITPPVQHPETTSVPTDSLKDGLRDALQPSHREIAAEQLVAGPQGRSADVRKALLLAIKEDPAPTVRSTCLRCLAKQGINDEIFQTAMKCAQEDKDPSVRQDAKMILSFMAK